MHFSPDHFDHVCKHLGVQVSILGNQWSVIASYFERCWGHCCFFSTLMISFRLMIVISFYMQMILALFFKIKTQISLCVTLMKSNLCNWFVYNKLSIDLSRYNTKSILFSNKRKIKKENRLNVIQNYVEFK